MNDSMAAQQGRLSQRCPACGIREAAGDFCTACLHPTGPADWHREARPQRGRMRPSEVQGAPEAPADVSEAIQTVAGL